MKKILLLVFLFPATFASNAIWKIGAGADSGPTQLLKNIFEITKIKNDGNIENVIKQTSFRWLRPKFMERWHRYCSLDREQKKELGELIKNSVLDKEKLPKQKHYDVLVVCCGWYPIIQKRIDFLIKLHNQGITFDKIYLLGTTRPLKNGPDDEKKLIPLLKQKNIKLNEMAMIEYLWHQTLMPDSLRSIPVELFNATKSSDGFRATMADVLKVMINNIKITKGSNFLLVTNNPYICMHDAVAKKVLEPYEVNVETVGAAMEGEELEDVLDSIARCLYNLQPSLKPANPPLESVNPNNGY